ncbi:MAG: hypothetical protein FJZ79_05150 [Chlorobi bacterium]|nr:hypothetical protein [Chlorobiota bacterium]
MRHKKRIVVHAGIHKTGSTSIQAFLGKNRPRLERLGIAFFRGAYIPDNHVELHAAAMRFQRSSPFKHSGKALIDHDFRKRVHHDITNFIAHSDCDTIVFSAEGISYLRYPDEMTRLAGMLAGGSTEIIMYLREPVTFLRSYSREMEKHRICPGCDKDSFAYTGKDSWLVDYPSRIAGFASAFGQDNVRTIDYDGELSCRGSVIPSFLEILGISSDFREDEWQEFFCNRTLTKPPSQKT